MISPFSQNLHNVVQAALDSRVPVPAETGMK